MLELKGLATGIGSLPYKDVDEALELIFKYCFRIPFWPQLPKRDIRENMVTQFSDKIPGLKVTRKGLVFSSADRDKELETFYEKVIANDVDYFSIDPDFALGVYRFYEKLKQQDLKEVEFIKCHIVGPFTFLAAVLDDKGIALLHDSVFRQVVIKALAMKALWQIKFFGEFSKKIILFFDEPYLGCFGSAYTPINREEVIKGLSELVQSVACENVLIGVHCCGNTDWSILTDIADIDIISFDAYSFLDKLVLYADNLKGFLERDGMLCWGIVPTQEFKSSETAEFLKKKVIGGIDLLVKKGLNRQMLLKNLLLSPSCGLGTLDVAESEKIFRLLTEVSSLIRKIS